MSHLNDFRNKASEFTIEQLLEHCGNVHSPYWQKAWQEFDGRFKNFICKKIAERAAALSPPRLQLQFSEFVEDITFEVQYTLLKHDCRAIREFRGKDNEVALLSWLKTICYRITGAYLRRNCSEHFSAIEAGSLEFVHKEDAHLDDLHRWELFQEIVTSLRESAARNARNTERDINIYLMCAMSGFSAEMFKYNPLLNHIGGHAVDVVVNRIRTRIRQNTNLMN